MSVDPNIDYSSHDPLDGGELSEDPRIREAQLLERRMRAALATKEHPLSDGVSTSERLQDAEKRVADAEGTSGAAADGRCSCGCDGGCSCGCGQRRDS